MPMRFIVCVVAAAGSAMSVPRAMAESQFRREFTSIHAGFFYPNGVDVIGYTTEREVWARLHVFYTFGFPALAAAGIAYYANYSGDGWVTTAGIGLGFAGYAAVSYQVKTGEDQFLKLGVGAASGILANGAFPSLSYEWRFR